MSAARAARASSRAPAYVAGGKKEGLPPGHQGLASESGSASSRRATIRAPSTSPTCNRDASR
eukprot:CAMPEP_0119266040 /NCGR_PEP_ID=MMETSP1329-20130426/4665_1 /TAXON_ID=114041 /ORGANISM="Genus nov. species nov., Strain RCC1024" /LENGTH=61 /DNA_ID=CAMNT_0007265901 /DNA_START=17 /DNA_END=199 /DNA_ORIENTATION=+